MAPPKAFLFDLDQTLVDSSPIAGPRSLARLTGNWSTVYANLHQVRPFGGAVVPHTLPAQLRAAGYRTGIVTSSPRKYAEDVLQRFGLRLGVDYDVLIAYHDTSNHKPHPDPIAAAVSALGLPPSEVCHVGDHADDHIASYRAGVRSIGAGWSVPDPLESSAAPDVLVRDPGLLLDPHVAERGGYLGEVLSDGMQPRQHHGSALPCGSGAVALGRYFTTGDPRHGASSLVANVLGLKNHDGPAAVLGRALGEYVSGLPVKPYYVVHVPPKPNQRNRFEAVLAHAQPLLGQVVPLLDGLICDRAIEGYKSMGADERRAAVRDAYRSKYTSWLGRSILLVDDVLTTDATITECARVLVEAGASSVSTVALAKDQKSFSPPRACPRCGHELRVKRGRRGPFWGCTAWRRDDPSSCQYTEDYAEDAP